MEKVSKRIYISKDRIVDWLLFSFIMGIWLFFCWQIFYRQSIRLDGKYQSDMYAHMSLAVGYDVDSVAPYPIFFFTIKAIYRFFFYKQFLGPELSIAIATLFYNSISIVVFKVVCDVYFSKFRLISERFGVKRCIFLSINNLLIFSIFLVNMIFDVGEQDTFFESMGPNPWHNGTYFAARPFVIISFFLFCDLVDKYEKEKVDIVEYILFSVSFVLMTLAKPSYSLVLGATAVVVLLYRFIKSRFRTFFKTLWISLTFVPTVIVLIVQYIILNTHGAESGAGTLTIAFGKVWSHYSDNIPLSIIKSGLFPLVVLIVYGKKAFKNSYMRISYVSYIIGILSYLSFTEAGWRELDANFAWGYMYSLMISYMTSLIFVVNETHQCSQTEEREKWKPIPVWVAYLINLVSGIMYFGVVLNGGK